MAKKRKKAEEKSRQFKDRKLVKDEDSEDDGTLDDPLYLIEYIKNCKKEAERASRHRREVQQELWMLYQNKESWKKKEWQSKVFIPKIFMAIERAAALVKRAILQTSKLFTMEQMDEETAPLNARIRELRSSLADEPKSKGFQEQIANTEKELDLLKEQLAEDEKRYKKELKRSNFVSAYGEMIKSALLLGLGVFKRLWDAEKKKLRFENIDIFNVYISPEYMPFEDENPDYLIEYKEMKLATLRKMAKKTNDAAADGSVFDMDEIEKIKSDSKKSEEEAKRRLRRGLSQYSPVSKKVGILEFWGTVVSKDGKTMKENQLMMLVNEKHLIRRQDNPFDNGRYPHDLTVPIVYPHRGIAGVSLVESGVRLQYTLNNILNMVVDNLNFVVNKVMTYQPTSLKRPQEIFSVYPGKMIPVSAGGDPIKEVKLTPLGQDAYKVYETVGNEIQEANAVTEFLMGMPGKKAKTLGEVEIKTAESQGLFDVIARELELNSIKPTLKGGYELLVQFSNFKGEYEFNVGGLSLLLLKKEQIETLMQAIMIAVRTPELKQITKIQELWKRLLDIWNFSDVYIEPEDIPVEEQAVLMPGQASGAPGAAPAGEQPTPEQIRAIDQQAAAQARGVVAKMSPEEIMAS